MTTPIKVAVFGGGVGSIVAAFELTATPELRERFDVTVHQLGWRLGGKGASGRDLQNGGRILEHGLHVWFGFYDTAWKAMTECYEELGRHPSEPLPTIKKAFTPCDQIVLFDKQGSRWHAFPFDFPPNGETPGDGGDFPTFWEICDQILSWWRSQWHELTPVSSALGSLLHVHTPLDDAHALVKQALAPDEPNPIESAFAELLKLARDGIYDLFEGLIRADPELRLYFSMFDLFVSSVAGVIDDGVLDDGWDVINDREWCEWLRANGAKPTTLGATPAVRSPILRCVYDVAFGYVDGDIDKADVAAGTAMGDLLRMMFTYRGAFFQKMNAGMGDTVFTPFYEVLKRRGVKFEFFSALDNVGLSPDGNVVETIDVIKQVRLNDEHGEYAPLWPVEDLPCWPSEPLWEQLHDGAHLQARGVNFELDPNPLGHEPTTLKLGVDFDQVVLGLSLGSLPGTCAEVIGANDAFRTAVETGVTVRTQAFQLWLTEPTDELGWEFAEKGVTGAYVEPLDTYCDMSHLLKREDWPPGTVESIAYFCGVLGETDGIGQDGATAAAKKNAVDFLKGDIGVLWPDAVRGGGVLDWNLLYDPSDETGEARFDNQYWRANTLGSERYVLTPHGTVADRLPQGGWGVTTMVCTGDWTKTGIDGGCVEAAAISGVRAASHLIGDDREISGEGYTWLRRQ
jgi:uncharacterized protein with NAD-binding domain and iron-sulfur cluster